MTSGYPRVKAGGMTFLSRSRIRRALGPGRGVWTCGAKESPPRARAPDDFAFTRSSNRPTDYIRMENMRHPIAHSRPLVGIGEARAVARVLKSRQLGGGEEV